MAVRTGRAGRFGPHTPRMGRGKRTEEAAHSAGQPEARQLSAPVYTGFETFEDSDSAPYYRSERRRVSADDTWAFVNQRLHGLMQGVYSQARRGPVPIGPDQLHRWHRYLFGEDFMSGGEIRRVDIEYPVSIRDAGELGVRRQRGAPPDRIKDDLEAACRAFREHIDAVLAQGGEVELMTAAVAAADLYAGILRIHPYEDGNGRVAFVALQAALLSQGIYAVWFDDVERHDEALGWALRTDIDPDSRPFARLIVERARAAMPDAGKGILGA